MKKAIAGIITAAILVGTAYADVNKTQSKEHNGLEKLKNELNLTDQQIQQLKEIKKEESKEMRNFMMKDFKNPFVEATKNGNFDREVFKNTVVENAKKGSEIKAKYIEKILAVLNEEQKNKFIKIMQEKFERMHEKMEKRF
ncbi:MAG: Spy/CpxP family protein refolding chaperone [Sulfurihydrogenibium sp.]